MLELIEPFKLH